MKILLILALFLITRASFAQLKNFHYPEKAFGVGINLSFIDMTYSNDLTYGYTSVWGGMQIHGLYQRNINNYFGGHVGLGLEYRGYVRELFFNDYQRQDFLALQIPAIAAIRPFKFLILETGIQANVVLVNNPQFEIDISKKPIELIGSFGLRFMLYRGLTFGLFIDRGLTPFQALVTESEDVAARHLGLGFGFRYFFY
jgi:hypothetical protein